jgi:hypothetical protein
MAKTNEELLALFKEVYVDKVISIDVPLKELYSWSDPTKFTAYLLGLKLDSKVSLAFYGRVMASIAVHFIVSHKFTNVCKCCGQAEKLKGDGDD